MRSGYIDKKIDEVNPEDNKVIPVNFVTEHKVMLSNLHMLINKEYFAILGRFDKLILSLRTANTKEYSLDKEQTSYNDLFDALRLSLKGLIRNAIIHSGLYFHDEILKRPRKSLKRMKTSFKS